MKPKSTNPGLGKVAENVPARNAEGGISNSHSVDQDFHSVDLAGSAKSPAIDLTHAPVDRPLVRKIDSAYQVLVRLIVAFGRDFYSLAA